MKLTTQETTEYGAALVNARTKAVVRPLTKQDLAALISQLSPEESAKLGIYDQSVKTALDGRISDLSNRLDAAEEVIRDVLNQLDGAFMREKAAYDEVAKERSQNATLRAASEALLEQLRTAEGQIQVLQNTIAELHAATSAPPEVGEFSLSAELVKAGIGPVSEEPFPRPSGARIPGEVYHLPDGTVYYGPIDPSMMVLDKARGSSGVELRNVVLIPEKVDG